MRASITIFQSTFHGPNVSAPSAYCSTNVKSWDDVPTPKGGRVPYFGHGILLVKPPGGRKRPWKNILQLKERYVPEGVDLLRLRIPMINPKGDGRVLLLFHPADGREVFRNEGKYPYRGEFFSVFGVLRERRPDIFGETKGLLLEEEERWHQIRSKVQQDLMRPKSALFFLEKMNRSSEEFVDFLRRERNPGSLTVANFLPMNHKFALEMAALVALDTKLGCFGKNPSESLLKHMKAIDVLVNKMVDLITSVPVWKVLPPRVSPTFRLIEDNMNVMADFVKAKVDESVEKMKTKDYSEASLDNLSVLEKLILRNGPNSAETCVTALDMIFGGVDTTGNTMSFLLYQLAKNPEKQEKLCSEIKSFNHDNLKEEDVAQMRYFRACLQESFRIHPTVPSTARVLNNDTILRGFKIPAGAFAMWDSRVMGSDPRGNLPIIGHANLLQKKPHGFKKSWKNIEEMKRKYVPTGVEMLRLKIPILNSQGNGWVVVVYDPEDAKTVYRNEGKNPDRGPIFATFLALRSRRKDVFGETTGILVEEGARWQELRSKVQQDMMRPKSALYYVDSLNLVCEDMVKCIKRTRDKNDQTIDDFLPLSHKFGLESISTIALDTRIGSFDEHPPSDCLSAMHAINALIKRFPEMLLSFPVWKFVPPRWSPLFRDIEDNFNIVIDFVKSRTDEAVQRVKEKGSTIQDENVSVLEKLILRNGEQSAITYVMAMDMMLAGIDTTGSVLCFLIYHLAKNPEKQEMLRKEVNSFGGGSLSAQNIGVMKYFRACLQESLRLTPTVNNMIRVLPTDTEIRGHLLPAGTMVTWYAKVIGQDTEQFSRPEEFIPERWIDEKNTIHPFAVRNFSHGPRMCIGKRFAELEVQLGVAKLIQNFQLEYAGEGDVDIMTDLVNIPDKPLKIKFTDI